MRHPRQGRRAGRAAGRVGIAVAALLAVGPVRAVDFTMTDLQGEELRLSDYRGKWVVVNYWATWCPPCLEEIPELVQFHEDHKDDDAVVIGVNSEDIDIERLRRFVDEFFITYPVVPDRPRHETPLGPLPGLPVTYVVSPGGEVVARQVGGVTGEMIESFIRRWEASSDPP